ncbi:MAG: hypothetical protein AAF542_01090 [Pseudomonadota bacterium]
MDSLAIVQVTRLHGFHEKHLERILQHKADQLSFSFIQALQYGKLGQVTLKVLLLFVTQAPLIPAH